MTDLERMVVRALEQLTGELFHAKPTVVEVARLQAITDPVVEAVRAHRKEDAEREKQRQFSEEFAEQMRLRAAKSEGRLHELRKRFKRYTEVHENHRAWCNGEYEGGTCSCDLDVRLRKLIEEKP